MKQAPKPHWQNSRLTAYIMAFLFCLSHETGNAQSITRGSTTGNTTAPGYNDPNQLLTVKDEKPAPNMYAHVMRPEQEAAARRKLNTQLQKAGKKPNILIVLMDDVGWSDLGFMGGGIAFGQPTPMMDRYASQGLVLTSAYSTPSCTPSRASLLTGQDPLHHGLLRPAAPGEPGGLSDPMTLPMVLQKLGYATHGVGKWHLGENKSGLPQNLGFDDFYGFFGVPEFFTGWRDVYFNPQIALSPDRFKYFDQREASRYEETCRSSNHDSCENGPVIDLSYVKELDDRYASYTEKLIRDGGNGKQPWFIMENTRGCHFFNYPSDKWAGRSPARSVYSDCIVEMDSVFGRLMKTLEDTHQDENTLVILTSDNGPECEVPPHAQSIFRGCKGTSWEGGVRIPMLVYWKGMIQQRRSDALTDQVDIFNSALSVAGVGDKELLGYLPKGKYIAGVDQSSFWLTDNGLPERRSRIYTMNRYFSAVRVDEFKWTITGQLDDAIYKQGYTGGFSGAVFTDTGGLLFSDLYTDPKETETIGNRYDNVLSVLQGALLGFMKDLKDYPPPDSQLGFYDNNPPMYQLGPEIRKYLKDGKLPEQGPRSD